MKAEDIAPGVNRRDILKAGLAGVAGVVAAASPLFMCSSTAEARGLFGFMDGNAFSLAFRNQHTGEMFAGAYRVGNKYLPDAFDQINVVLRDYRTNDVFPIDPRVIDIIYAAHAKTGAGQPMEILSGYRSPRTNDMLHRSSGGVARNSLHLTGQAVDFRVPGYSTRRLRDVAAKMHAGGVGYYASSDFVHVDTGRVRHW